MAHFTPEVGTLLFVPNEDQAYLPARVKSVDADGLTCTALGGGAALRVPAKYVAAANADVNTPTNKGAYNSSTPLMVAA